ncbi:MAG: translocation/assembly module TamB domain-containing protein [Saprospiraceae bacterium]|jgi:hypothetical protein|nr:translocation/assembly module TamB domain-containing protein [Saprospiraceae bacterium]
MDHNPSSKVEFHRITVGRRILRLFFGIIFLAFIVIGLVLVLIQLPIVQREGVSMLTNFIESRTGSKASISGFYLTWRGELLLEEVYLEDLNGDTLLVADQVGTRILRDFQGLIQGRLALTDLYIGGASFHLKTYADGTNNINLLLKKLFPPKAKQKRKPFELDINYLRLNNFEFSDQNYTSGKRLTIQSGKAFIQVKCISFDPLDFEFGKVRAEYPIVNIEQLPITEETRQVESVKKSVRRKKVPYNFRFDELVLDKAKFILESGRLASGLGNTIQGIDFNNLNLDDVNINIQQFTFDQDHLYQGQIVGIQLKEKSGFQLDQLSSSSFNISSSGASFAGLSIQTPHSLIGDSLLFNYQTYADFLDFNNKVLMEGYFRQSHIQVRDLLYFAPGLRKSAIINQNESLDISINGFIGSRINNLKGKDLEIRAADKIKFKGDFSSRNLAVKGEQSLNLKLDELSTSVSTLKQLIPGLKLPASFSKLGKLKFSGRFDGFLVDFVSYGTLHTALGIAKMDMRMNVKGGVNKAEYSGNLGLKQFDLATWTGNPKFGTVTFHSIVRNGKGLTLKNLNAELEATIDSIDYQDYVYRNLKINGKLTKDRFNGQFDIRDEAVDFFFEGFVHYGDSLPLFDFRSIINKLDLHKLNFVDKPLVLSGILDFNLQGKNLNGLTGTARAMKVLLLTASQTTAKADSVIVRLTQPSAFQRTVNIDSDLANLEMEGDFQLLEIPQIFFSRMGIHFPELANRFRIPIIPSDSLESKSLRFAVVDRNLDEFIRNFSNRIPFLDGATGSGNIDLVSDKTIADFVIPQLRLKDYQLRGLSLAMKADGVKTKVEVSMDTLEAGSQIVQKISVVSDRVVDQYAVKLNVNDVYPYGTNITGKVGIDSSGYHISMVNDSLVFTNQSWSVAPENIVTIDSGFLALQNFVFTSKGRLVEVKDIQNKGLILHLKKLDMEVVNDYLNYDKIKFGGDLNVDLMVRDVFKVNNFAVMVQSDDFLMNGDHFGELYIMAAMPTIKSPMELDLELNQLGERIKLEGKWFHDDFSKDGGSFDIAFTARQFPLSIGEYFLNGAIVNTNGSFDADLKLTGPLKKPDIDGSIDVDNLETVIDYLGVKYAVPEGRINVNSTLFDATGITLYDIQNNTATVQGGIAHDNFKNWRLDCLIQSDLFMALNTPKQNNLYYGTGIGKLDVRFTGPLTASNIYVKAVTAKGSNLSIPVSESSSPVQQQFVEFYERRNLASNDERSSKGIKGLQLEMDIEMTEDALVQIIFDERSGDILRGYGRGNIRLDIPRSGSLKMYGSYVIDRGDYLFTFQNLVNKSFAVERGGTIQWSGDPFDAQINIKTIYVIPSAPVNNLIADYLENGSPGLEQTARSPTEVHLLMNLTGKLLQPDIAFDFAFPRLFGEVRSLVESEMQNLRRDPNKLNWQVFGLLVANNFLPPNLSRQQGTEYVATINTVSEMVSNQFSRYLTALMTELVSDVGVISDIGLNVNYNFYQSQSITQIDEAFKDSEFHIRQRINFYDDRLSLAVEGSVINTRGIESSGAILIGGDFRVEYALTPDRQLKLRVYQRSEPTILGNSRYKVGAGITFRKEFE